MSTSEFASCTRGVATCADAMEGGFICCEVDEEKERELLIIGFVAIFIIIAIVACIGVCICKQKKCCCYKDAGQVQLQVIAGQVAPAQVPMAQVVSLNGQPLQPVQGQAVMAQPVQGQAVMGQPVQGQAVVTQAQVVGVAPVQQAQVVGVTPPK